MGQEAVGAMVGMTCRAAALHASGGGQQEDLHTYGGQGSGRGGSAPAMQLCVAGVPPTGPSLGVRMPIPCNSHQHSRNEHTKPLPQLPPSQTAAPCLSDVVVVKGVHYVLALADVG